MRRRFTLCYTLSPRVPSHALCRTPDAARAYRRYQARLPPGISCRWSSLNMPSTTPFQQIDALTLAAIAGELVARAMGARIEDAIAPTPHSVALQLYAPGLRGWLLASAHPQLARVHLAAGKPRKLIAEPPTFVMLLRKYLEGSRLVAVHQPRWERIIEL